MGEDFSDVSSDSEEWDVPIDTTGFKKHKNSVAASDDEEPFMFLRASNKELKE